MRLTSLARGAVRKLRPAVHRVPLVGHGVRYAKRLVFLPWNFHKFLAAWNAAPPTPAAQAAHQAAWDAAGTVRATVWDATQAAAHVTVGQTWLAADGVLKELKGVAGDVAAELRRLNETHAMCYDSLRTAARDQAADLRRLTDTLADLTARVDDLAARDHHAPTLLRRAG